MRTLTAVLLSLLTVAHAEDGGLLPGLVSTPLLLPVSIAGNDATLDSYVIRTDRPGRFPLVIMTGGTPSVASPRNQARRSPIVFNRAAIAFAQRGYATITIMRRGYGLSGGGFAENLQQPCDYLPAVRNSGDDTIATTPRHLPPITEELAASAEVARYMRRWWRPSRSVKAWPVEQAPVRSMRSASAS